MSFAWLSRRTNTANKSRYGDQSILVSSKNVLRKRKRSVVIATVYKDPAMPAATAATATALGLHLRLTNNNQDLTVESLDANSPLRATPLREGMILFQINAINVEYESLTSVETILQNAVGRIRIWAEVESPPPPPIEGDNDCVLAHNDDDYYLEERHTTSSTSRTQTGNKKNNNKKKDKNTRGIKQQQQQQQQGTTFLAVAHKEDVDRPLGISLVRSPSGTFSLGSIHPSSPLAVRSSLLCKGMVVTSINGLLLAGRDLHVALSTVRDATGSLLIAAQVPEGMAEPARLRQRIIAHGVKRSLDEPMGLSLIKVPNTVTTPFSYNYSETSASTTCGGGHGGHGNGADHLTVVSRIAPNSPFCHTDLEIGMELKSINGWDVSKSDARAVLHLLKECHHGSVELEAERDILLLEQPQQPPLPHQKERVPAERGVLATTHHMESSSGSSPVPRNYHTVSSSMSNNNSSTTTAMSSSHQTNGTSLPSLSLAASSHPSASQPPSSQEPHSHSLAAPASSSSSSPFLGMIAGAFTATVNKESLNHVVGVALEEDGLGSFFISEVAPTSPFLVPQQHQQQQQQQNHAPYQHHQLQVGDEVLSINGVQLAALHMSVVAVLFRNIVGPLVLECLSRTDGHLHGGGWLTSGEEGPPYHYPQGTTTATTRSRSRFSSTHTNHERNMTRMAIGDPEQESGEDTVGWC